MLFSGIGTVLLLVGCASGETLGSNQPELMNTRFSIAELERFCVSIGPRRKTSYLVITPEQEENELKRGEGIVYEMSSNV